MGGDLNFFSEAIRGGRREALRAYARACVDCVHAASRGFDTGAISLAMIEGTALGGGFEAALAHHFVLAQNNARMGFPEMAFNLFPGMGGYSLVARRSGMRLAEELIGTGESHTAEWFQARGLSTCCSSRATPTRPRAPSSTCCGPSSTARAPCCARASVLRLSRSELMDITEDWVEAAFSIDPKDRAYMERLVVRRTGAAPPGRRPAWKPPCIERPRRRARAGAGATRRTRSGDQVQPTPPRQPFGELGRRHGLGVQIALLCIHAQGVEEGGFLGRLDALGDHLQLQRARHRHDGARQRLRDRVLVDPRTKLASSLIASSGMRASCDSEE